MFREIAGQMAFELEHGICAQRLALLDREVVVVITEEPSRGKHFEGGPLSWHPWTDLPDQGQTYPAIPAVLAEVQRLVVVVLTDRERQIHNDVQRELGLVAEKIGDGPHGLGAEEIDARLDHRVPESCGILV